MAGKSKKEHIMKRKVVPKQKSYLLDTYCDDEQHAIIRNLIEAGSTFILLGSEHAPKHEFYKGLMQEMYSPTFNGACVYDSWYKFRNAFDRPIITIALNDAGNKNIVDSIKRLNATRSRTLYSKTYSKKDGGDTDAV